MHIILEKIYSIPKSKLIKIINICFWCYLLFSYVILIFRECILDPEFEKIKINYSIQEIIFTFVVRGTMAVILENFLIILSYIALIFGIRKYKKEKLSSIDFKKYKGYFREILKEYSPAELSYIDDFDISYENDIAATLLSLELKQVINMDENENKIIIKNKEKEKLSQNELYVLDNIKDGKLNKVDEGIFRNIVTNDLKKNEVIIESEFKKKAFKGETIIFAIVMIVLITFIVFFISASMINSEILNDTSILILVVAMMLVMNLPIAAIVYFFTYMSKIIKNKYVRTKKGERINEKLEGLKNYLKDYSYINEKKKEELVLWEEYMIYSVIFKQNKNIINNIFEKYININN